MNDITSDEDLHKLILEGENMQIKHYTFLKNTYLALLIVNLILCIVNVFFIYEHQKWFSGIAAGASGMNVFWLVERFLSSREKVVWHKKLKERGLGTVIMPKNWSE